MAWRVSAEVLLRKVNRPRSRVRERFSAKSTWPSSPALAQIMHALATERSAVLMRPGHRVKDSHITRPGADREIRARVVGVPTGSRSPPQRRVTLIRWLSVAVPPAPVVLATTRSFPTSALRVFNVIRPPTAESFLLTRVSPSSTSRTVTLWPLVAATATRSPRRARVARAIVRSDTTDTAGFAGAGVGPDVGVGVGVGTGVPGRVLGVRPSSVTEEVGLVDHAGDVRRLGTRGRHPDLGTGVIRPDRRWWSRRPSSGRRQRSAAVASCLPSSCCRPRSGWSARGHR